MHFLLILHAQADPALQKGPQNGSRYSIAVRCGMNVLRGVPALPRYACLFALDADAAHA